MAMPDFGQLNVFESARTSSSVVANMETAADLPKHANFAKAALRAETEQISFLSQQLRRECGNYAKLGNGQPRAFSTSN